MSAGAWGGLRPVEQLQMVFAHRNAHVYPERVFIAGSSGKLTPEGAVSDAALDERIGKQAAGFARFAHVLGGHG